MKISYVNISQLERGERDPQYETLQRIASALNVSDDILFYGFEIDREYELICDTLNRAGYNVEQAIMADEFYISPKDAETAEETVEITYSRLTEIVHKALADAEINKATYIQKRIEAELFWPKGWGQK